MPQPNFVPVRPMTSRSTHKSGMSEGTSSVCALPFILRVTIGRLHVRIIRVDGRASHADVHWESTPSADERHLAPYRVALNNPPSRCGGARDLVRETVAKHRKAALRLRTRNLVLPHLPMLGQNAIGEAHDVRRNPVHRSAITRESPVYDHEIAFGNDHTRFVLERP